MKRILERCNEAGIPYKTIPGLAEIIEDSGLSRQIRDVAVEDLLGRTRCICEQNRISATVRDRVVLVTGAAGSIGSELCRQIARFQPAAIIGYEIAESPFSTCSRRLPERSLPRNLSRRSEVSRIRPGSRTFSSGTGPRWCLSRGGLQARAADGSARFRSRGEQRLRAR